MKFEITNTEDYDEKPHPDAVLETHTHIDLRTIPTLERAKELIPNKSWIKDWFNIGKNHREIKVDLYKDRNSDPSKLVDTMIARDLEGYKRWVIEIDDLLEWVTKLNGSITITPKRFNCSRERLFTIEI